MGGDVTVVVHRIFLDRECIAADTARFLTAYRSLPLMNALAHS